MKISITDFCLDVIAQKDLAELAIDSVTWDTLSGREKDIFLAGMAHAKQITSRKLSLAIPMTPKVPRLNDR